MFPSRLKFLVVALVALLQCFAPLIHGHANAHELDGVSHVHLHGDVVEVIEQVPGATPAVDKAHDHTPAIGVAKEFKRDGFFTLLIQAVLIGSALILLAVAARAGFHSRGHRREPKASPHAHPPATAPPGGAA